MTGDGKDDVCVRSSSDFRCHRSLGNGFAAAAIGPARSDAFGEEQRERDGHDGGAHEPMVARPLR